MAKSRAYEIAFMLNAKMSGQFGKAFAMAGSKAERLGTTLTSIGKRVSLMTAPLKAVGAASFAAAKNWESAWTSVRKVTKASEEDLQALEATARQMARELPHTHKAIASVFEAGSRLGVATEHLENFSRTMLAVEATTTLSLESAADGFAILANIMGTSQSDFDRMGSTILYLGSNFATTEAEILKMSQNMAGAAVQANLSESEVMGLSTAISSIGLSASAGASAFSGFISDMGRAVAVGGDGLEQFAEVAGMSTLDFAHKFETDAMGAVTAFIGGLGQLNEQGGNTLLTLDEMGLSGIYMSQMLLGLSGAYDTMVDAIARSNTAWEENSFLMYAVEERYATMEARMQVMRNQLKDAGITIGKILLPFVERVVDKIGKWVEWFNNLDESTHRNVIRIGALAATIGPVLLIAGKLITLTIKVKSFFGKLTSTTLALNAALKKMAFTTFPTLKTSVNASLKATLKKRIALKATLKTAAGLNKGIILLKLGFLKLKKVMLANPVIAMGAAIIGVTAAVTALVRRFRQSGDAVNSNRVAIEQLTAQNDKLAESHMNLVNSYRKSISAVNEESRSAGGLINRLTELSSQSNLTAAEQEQMTAIVCQLNNQFPVLALSIDQTTGNLNQSTAAIREMAHAQAEQQRIAARHQTFVDALAQEIDLREQLAKVAEEYAAAQQRMDDFGGTPVGWNNSREFNRLNGELSDISAEYARLNAILYENLSLQKEIEAAWQAQSQAMEEAAKAAVTYDEAVNRTINSIASELKILAEHYDEVLESAQKSIQGQFSLWDRAAEVVAKSVDSVTANLESQAAHWQAYNENLRALTGRTSEIEGLSALIATFADGSQNSVNMIAGMANATDAELKSMVYAWATLQEEQAAVSHSIADLTTDFAAGLDEIESRMQNAVNNMNMENEASNAARITIQAYINEIRSMTGEAHSAAAAVAMATSNALRGGGTNIPVVTVPGYAAGTEYTKDTFIAGEQGPELITGAAGRKVFTALETGNILQNSRLPNIFNFDDEENPAPPRFIDNVHKFLKGDTYQSDSPTFTYSPNITVQGGGYDISDMEIMIKDLLRKDKSVFQKMFMDCYRDMKMTEARLANG